MRVFKVLKTPGWSKHARAFGEPKQFRKSSALLKVKTSNQSLGKH
jgi:hypothetical protein